MAGVAAWRTLNIEQRQFLRFVADGGTQAAFGLVWHHAIGMKHLKDSLLLKLPCINLAI